MFRAFYWMFLNEDMKKSFLQNNSKLLIFCGLSFAFYSFAVLISNLNISLISKLFINFIAIILFLFPYLVMYGYFWDLTESIIYRKEEIESSNVYNGKIRKYALVEIPDINILKFTWRGIASIVAILILILAVGLMWIGLFMTQDPHLMLLAVILSLIVYLFSLGLFWNYAKRNSVFSTLNIFAGIHLLGVYPLRYIWNGFLWIVYCALNSSIGALLYKILGLGMLQSAVIDPVLYLRLGLYGILLLCWYLYMLYVGAYIIGTLAPTDDF